MPLLSFTPKNITVLVFQLLLTVLVFLSKINQDNSQAIDLFPAELMLMGVLIVLGFITALIATIWIGLKKLNAFIVILPVLSLVLLLSGNIFGKKKSNNPVLFQVSDGALAGSLAIQFRTGNIYTLLTSSGISNSWDEGRYSIQHDTILLNGPTDVMTNTLLIKRDSTNCPIAITYRYKDGLPYREDKLRVVFDSLFCRKK